MSKIMNVYYGTDTLPYKDKECSVHFPIIGQTFAGSSLVDAIKFYVGKIGGINDIEWLAIVKKPDGTFGYQSLEADSDSDGVFVTLPLSSFYTEKKGDLYITLNGYQGGVSVSQDELDIWHVNGTPIVQVAGAVKLTIAYAPVLPQNTEELETITIQDALGLVSSKLDKNSPYFLKVVNVSNIESINSAPYGQYLQSGDVLYNKYDRKFWKIASGSFGTFVVEEVVFDLEQLEVDDLNVETIVVENGIIIPNFDWIENTDNVGLATYINGLVSPKADKSYVDTKFESYYTISEINTTLANYETIADVNSKLANYSTTAQMDEAIATAVSSAYKYKGSVATYGNLPSSGNQVGDVYNVEDTGDNYAWTGTDWDKLSGTVDLSGYLQKSTTANTIYAVNGSGQQVNESYGTSATSGYIVKRDGNGQVLVPTSQTADNQATSKSYVDTNKVDKTRTIAGIALSSDITAQALTNALIYASNSDIESIMED